MTRYQVTRVETSINLINISEHVYCFNSLFYTYLADWHVYMYVYSFAKRVNRHKSPNTRSTIDNAHLSLIPSLLILQLFLNWFFFFLLKPILFLFGLLCISLHGCFPVKSPNYLIAEAPSNPLLNLPFKCRISSYIRCWFGPLLFQIH